MLWFFCEGVCRSSFRNCRQHWIAIESISQAALCGIWWLNRKPPLYYILSFLNNTYPMQYGGTVYLLTHHWNTVLYLSVTSDLIARIGGHRDKVHPNSFTAKYNTCKLVWYEFFPHIEEVEMGMERGPDSANESWLERFVWYVVITCLQFSYQIPHKALIKLIYDKQWRGNCGMTCEPHLVFKLNYYWIVGNTKSSALVG